LDFLVFDLEFPTGLAHWTPDVIAFDTLAQRFVRTNSSKKLYELLVRAIGSRSQRFGKHLCSVSKRPD
jgi:hypothetical protein